jgi:DNA helicase HerA-like ATPase
MICFVQRPMTVRPAVNDKESADVLKTEGDIRLGVVAGHENVIVGVPSDKKSVLPRHTAILGTTGGGKSTTVARFIQQQEQGTGTFIIGSEQETINVINVPVPFSPCVPFSP